MSGIEDPSDLLAQGGRLSVMICDSSPVQIRILKQALQDAGYCVRVAGSAELALREMREEPADIFLTGLELKGMSGLEACWQLKSDPATDMVFTIVLNASTDVRKLEESLDSGADDFLRKPFDMIELLARIRAAARMVRMQQRLRALADTDPLTGAANRRKFIERLDACISESRADKSPLSVIMLDLDHFKRTNDTYGHAGGDLVLKATVETVEALLEKGDILGRLGGEEFAILLRHADEDNARWVAERVRAAIEGIEVHAETGSRIPVSASLGVATGVGGFDLLDCDAFLHDADEALYVAKQTGRNRVVHAMDRGADEQAALTG